ncbi:MAG: hypothetical protein JRI74_11405 [Deltaproteobacteria bacterium]|nr:hypothetical protein [Deltaproteobacteria bacterium]MBW2217287.1 hypothetical protein [Deltaproteobacteria bacterium]
MGKKDLPQDALPSASCPGQIELPTPKERESLDAMRSIKENARELKKRLRLLKSSGTEENAGRVPELEEELAVLQKEWEKLEKKWKADVRGRMVYLGHDEE